MPALKPAFAFVPPEAVTVDTAFNIASLSLVNDALTNADELNVINALLSTPVREPIKAFIAVFALAI